MVGTIAPGWTIAATAFGQAGGLPPCTENPELADTPCLGLGRQHRHETCLSESTAQQPLHSTGHTEALLDRLRAAAQ